MNIKKFFIYIITIFILSQIFFFILVNSLDKNKISDNLIKYFDKNLNIKISISNLKLRSNLLPSILIDEIKIDSGIILSDLILNLNIISLMKGDIEISTVYSDKIEIQDDNFDYKKTYYSILEQIFIFGEAIPTIHIKNTNIKQDFLNNITDLRIDYNNKIINIKGNLNDNKYSFSVISEKKSDNIFNIVKISSNHFNFILSEEFKNNISNGILDLNIAKTDIFFEFASSYLKIPDIILDEKDLKIHAKFIYKNNELEIPEINIKNKNLDAAATYISNSANKQNASLSILINFINLNNIKKIDLVNLDLNDLDTDIQINIQNASAGNINLSNINITAINKDDLIYFENFSGNIENGKFVLDAKIQNINNASEFSGFINIYDLNLDSVKNDYHFTDFLKNLKNKINFSSNFIIRKNILSLTNSVLTLENQKIKFNLGFDFAKPILFVKGDIKLTNLDIDYNDFPIINTCIDYIKKIIFNSKDENYLSYFIPLRLAKFQSSIRLKIDHLFSKNTDIGELNTLINFSPGFVEIEKLTLKNSDISFQGSSRLFANGITPKFDFTIDNAVINTNDRIYDKIIKLYKIIKQIDPNKLYLNIQANISEITLKNYTAKNINIFANTNINEFSVNELKFDVFGGNVNFSGYISYSKDEQNIFSFSISSISLAKFLNFIAPSVSSIKKSQASIAGNLSFIGEDLKSIIYNLDIDSNFKAIDMIIENLSLNDAVNSQIGNHINDMNFSQNMSYFSNNGVTKIPEILGKLNYSKGLLNLDKVEYKLDNENSSATLVANIDIYKLTINLQSLISFYVNKSEEPFIFIFSSVGNLLNPTKSLNKKN